MLGTGAQLIGDHFTRRIFAVPQRSTNDKDREQPSKIGNRQHRTSGVLALIRREDLEAMRQLAASHQDLEICATADAFLTKCADSQYQVAILPSGVLSQNDRMLLRGYLTSLELHPSIILYSPTSDSLPWPGWLDAEDITILMKPFTEARFRNVIAHAMQEFGERSRQRRC
jgi:hypothetical protein